MGNLKSCCHPETVVADKLTECNYPPQQTTPIQQRPQLKQNRLPPPIYFEIIENNEQSQQKITEFKANDRKFKRPVKVNLPPIQKNRLEDVYLVKDMDAYYIGQWAFDKYIEENLPTGIGRLYDAMYICEGQFETKHQQMIGQHRFRMNVMLQGKGRKFNKVELLEGDFKQGLLDGTGVYKNKKEEYMYEGTWEKGRRNGRGVEKTKKYTYNGEFKYDRKQGKGIYTHQLNTIQNRNLELQDKRVREHFKRQDAKDQSQKQRKAKERQSKVDTNKTVKKLLQKYEWKNPFVDQSLFSNPDFYKERLVRTCYQEIYTGDFLNDEFHGDGMYTWHSGKVYRGEWKHGKIDGIGEFLWANNISYKGEYVSDLKHGKGEMIWNDNVRWRGSWAFGLRHGYGESIQVDPLKKLVRVKGAKWDQDKQIKVYFREVLQFNGQVEPWADWTDQSQLSASQVIGQKLQEQASQNYIKILPVKKKVIFDQDYSDKEANNNSNKKPDEKIEVGSGIQTHKSKADLSTAKTWMRPNFFDS